MVVSPPAPGLRIDGVEKVTGGATFAADITRQGMLYAKVLRSPYPHARILSIDASRARALTGVHVVLTGMDLPDARIGRSMRDMPVLARDKVRTRQRPSPACVDREDARVRVRAAQHLGVEHALP